MIQGPEILDRLRKLHVDRSKGSPAPHKAVLLISVINLLETGVIRENKIFITPELVARFKDNWQCFVTSNRFTPNFSLPFYHLKSEKKLWSLRTIPGIEKFLTSSHSIKSFSALKNAVDYAFLTDDFYQYLQSPKNRAQAIKEISKIYFGLYDPLPELPGMLETVERQMLYEPAYEYRLDIQKSDEEELFVRSGVFKRVVPRIYNYTCCVSGMQIITTRDIQMVDACHIVPFAESHDDTIRNGISLSPNLHRAFDRFLISVNPDYRIVVSDNFIEAGQHSIKEFHGRLINLPEHRDFRPDPGNLRWHFDKFSELRS